MVIGKKKEGRGKICKEREGRRRKRRKWEERGRTRKWEEREGKKEAKRGG